MGKQKNWRAKQRGANRAYKEARMRAYRDWRLRQQVTRFVGVSGWIALLTAAAVAIALRVKK